MRDFEGKWFTRAPKELVIPHSHVVGALRAITDLFLLVENLHDFEGPSGKRIDWEALAEMMGEGGEVDKAGFLRRIAKTIVDLRDNIVKGCESFALVEEDFAVVAEGIPNWRGGLAVSWHTSVLRIASIFFDCITEAIEFQPPTDNIAEGTIIDCFPFYESFTQEDILPHLERLGRKNFPRLAKSHPCLKEPVEVEEVVTLLIRLQHEVCRAWKRKYPGRNDAYEVLSENGLSKLAALTEETSRSRSRPAHSRDHLWLRWHENERLGAAKIRDRWDSEPEQRRKGICPTAWDQVGGDAPHEQKAGYEIVKAALKKARKERHR